MTFGLIKSIIEDSLLESYKDEKSFKKALNEFKHNVLNNKDISKIYSLYDDLSNPQGLNQEDAKEFVSEGISLIQKLLPSVKLPKIVGESKVKNKYTIIDELVYTNNKINLSERLQFKKQLVKNLQESANKNVSNVNIPISSMVKIANQTLNSYIENLDEGSKKEFFEIIKEDSKELEVKFNSLKETALEKLVPLMESENDSEIKSKLKDTINKIQEDSFNQINFLRLKKLQDSI
jgi:hypothetical protein